MTKVLSSKRFGGKCQIFSKGEPAGIDKVIEMSVMPTALEGIRRAEERVQRAAERLARLPLSADGASEDVVDLSAETVALLEARTAHAANAAVAQTAQELEQHLLDILG